MKLNASLNRKLLDNIACLLEAKIMYRITASLLEILDPEKPGFLGHALFFS
jgi:hypothetical protein